MGRPLKIRKEYGGIPVDRGYPNDGTTNNGFTTSAVGVVGGVDFAITAYPYVAVEQIEQGVITASTATTTVNGLNTQFGGSTFDVGSQVYAYGVEDMLGTVASINAAPTDTATATTASNDRITITDSSGFIVGGAVVFASSVGNIVGGTVYYVYDKPTATTIRVSSTPDLATIFQLADTTLQSVAIVGYETLTLNANSDSSVTSSAWSTATPDEGFIVRQKGKRKYLVVREQALNDEFFANGQTYYINSLGNTNWQALGAGPDAAVGKIFVCTGENGALTTNGNAFAVGVCTLTNDSSSNLIRNQMSMTLDKASGGDPYCQSLTNHFATDFTNNGTDENSGTKYLVSFNAKTNTPDPATGLITVDIDYAC